MWDFCRNCRTNWLRRAILFFNSKKVAPQTTSKKIRTALHERFYCVTFSFATSTEHASSTHRQESGDHGERETTIFCVSVHVQKSFVAFSRPHSKTASQSRTFVKAWPPINLVLGLRKLKCPRFLSRILIFPHCPLIFRSRTYIGSPS